MFNNVFPIKVMKLFFIFSNWRGKIKKKKNIIFLLKLLDSSSSEDEIEKFFKELGSGSAKQVPPAVDDDQEFEKTETVNISFYNLSSSLNTCRHVHVYNYNKKSVLLCLSYDLSKIRFQK